MPRTRKVIRVHVDHFTPGPWLENRPDKHGDIGIVGEESQCFPHVVVQDGGNARQLAANVALVKAAPDLLDALRKLMAEREFERVEGSGGERYWSPINSDAWRAADAALSKAEGRGE